MTEPKTNRRTFMKTTTHAAAFALAGTALSYSKVQGANDRIRMGLIGCGGRGRNALNVDMHKACKDLNIEVAAICDVWRLNREAAAQEVKEYYGREPKQFSRFADLLELDDIDAVMIATPDFAHSPILAAAARAGKDAYCEKPMATNMRDARNAVDAIRENKRIVQIGTQRRSDGKHKGAAKLIQSGILGTITQVETAWNDKVARWNRPFDMVKEEDVDWEQYQMGLRRRPFDPRRFRCWHLYKDYTVGVSGLLGSHLMDVALWFMDDPLPLWGTGEGGIFIWKEREHCDTFEGNLVYPKGFLLRYSNRFGNIKSGPEVVFYGSRGVLDSATFTARPEGAGDPIPEEVKAETLPGENHMANFINCVRSRQEPNAPVEAGYNHSVASIIMSESQFRGKRLYYDTEKRDISEHQPKSRKAQT